MPTLASLTDDFTTQDAAKWTFSSGASVTGGQAVVVPSNGYPAVYTPAAYDFTGSYGMVRLVTPPNVGNGSTSAYFAVGSFAASNRVQMTWAAGALYASWFNGSNVETGLTSTSYNSTSHRYWRISESGGTIYCETSPDASTWTQLTSVSAATTGITLTSTGLSMGAGYWGTEPSPGSAVWDYLNVMPARTGNYTLTATDVAPGARPVEVDSGSAVTITVPTNANVPCPIGTTGVEVYRAGTGTVTFAAASGVTLESPAAAVQVRAQYSSAFLRKRGTNTWVISGEVA